MKFVTALLLAAAVAVVPAFGQQPEAKRRVAVLDFGYGSVMTSVQSLFGTTQDVGKGISDLIVDRFLKSGTYRVIERRELGKIMAEQNFSNSDRADAATAAKIGRLLGVDSVIVGDITQFGRDDKNTNIAGALGRFDKYGLGGSGVKKAKAAVAITARLIDVNTAEILASESGKGESTRSGTNLVGGGFNMTGAGSGAVDMSSSNFSQTLIGEAVNGAVTQLATKLEGDSGKLPLQTVKIEGLVADVTDPSSIVINVGSKAGLRAGDRLSITRVSRVIKDPVSGKPLRTVESAIGELQITSVDEASAVGKFTGSGTPNVGDKVKSSQ
jgi:curli biogenesis system outer membrane secretion channel CsgG